MGQVFINNGRARLKSAITSTQTEMRLEQVVNFPTNLAVGDWFLVTLANQNTRYGNGVEVVKVTAIDIDRYTIVRGYEGEAVSHPVTDVVESRLTADTLKRAMETAVWEYVGNKPAEATRWPEWDEVTGKPGAFTPTTHNHVWGEITGRPATADRWPAWNEVTGKPNNYPPSSHGHAWSQLSDVPATARRWPTWSEVDNKPLTTSSRSDNSTSTLLQAKGMNDHVGSGDHDSRYYTKSQSNSNYLSVQDGGTVNGDVAVKQAGVATSELLIEGGRLGGEAPINKLVFSNNQSLMPASIETWTHDGTSHELEFNGFAKTKIASAVEITNKLLLSNTDFNAIDIQSNKTTGSLGGIRFHSNGIVKGSLLFQADGSIRASDSGFFSGDGSGLQSLNASELDSGTVSIGRLPNTTSRTSTSTSHLLTAKAMSDHTESGDHDDRYYRKNEFTDTDASNTPVIRNSAGDVKARLFTSTYPTTNDDIVGIYTTRSIGGDYMRPSTPGQVKNAIGLGNVRNVDAYSKGEAESRYVNKSGDTMTGDLEISKSNAWLTLNPLNSGSSAIDQGAGISIGESGKKGSAAIHMTYTGDGRGWLGMGSVGTDGKPANVAMGLFYATNNVNFFGDVDIQNNGWLWFKGAGKDDIRLNLDNDSELDVFNQSKKTYATVNAKFKGDGSLLTGTSSMRATGTTAADVGLDRVPNWAAWEFDSRYWRIGVPTGYAPNKNLNDYQAGEGGYGRSSQANYPSGSSGYNIVTMAGYGGSDLTQWALPQRGNYEIWFRTKDGTNWRGWRKVLTTDNSDSFNDGGTYSNLRAQRTTKGDVGLGNVGNYTSTSNPFAATHVVRDSSSDIWARLFRSTYTSTNSTIGVIWTSRNNSGGDFIRPSTPAQVRDGLGLGNVYSRNITSSRTANSSSYVLTAEGMYDHTNSGDHDGRYYTKSQGNSRYAYKTNSFNGVGSYMLAEYMDSYSGGTKLRGDRVPGSDLKPTHTNGDDRTTSSIRASGTWECMGRAEGSNNYNKRTTLWHRIS